MHNEHVNKKRGDGRVTTADLIGLGLRDKLDIMTGDWNQAGGYLEECCYHAVKFYEKKIIFQEVPFAGIFRAQFARSAPSSSTGASKASNTTCG